MMRLARQPLISGILFVTAACCGCFRTTVGPESSPFTLPPDPINRQLNRLAAVNRVPLRIEVRSDRAEERAGFQYLFIGFPLSRVYAPQQVRLVEERLKYELTVRGYKVATGGSGRLLQVDILDLSLSGYDFLFFRRPSASIKLRAAFSDDLNVYAERTADSSEFAKFAFERELARALQEAAGKAVVALLDDLHLFTVAP